MAVYRKILVPLDESALSDRVLDTALATAQWSGAELVLLRVTAERASLAPGESDVDLRVIGEEADTLLARAAARARACDPPITGDRVRAEIRVGNVADTIVAAAEELMVDLIVMGTHGREGLKEQFTGSTSEQVLARAPASVFILRPEGYPYLRD